MFYLSKTLFYFLRPHCSRYRVYDPEEQNLAHFDNAELVKTLVGVTCGVYSVRLSINRTVRVSKLIKD
jgi:hypothetical protein